VLLLQQQKYAFLLLYLQKLHFPQQTWAILLLLSQQRIRRWEEAPPGVIEKIDVFAYTKIFCRARGTIRFHHRHGPLLGARKRLVFGP
jgi:hypothetical protein